MIGMRPSNECARRATRVSASVCNGRTAQPARLVAKRNVLRKWTRNRRVRCDAAVDADIQQHFSQCVGRHVVEVGRHLRRQRYISAALRVQFRLAPLQAR
jgi:hypothetical protein